MVYEMSTNTASARYSIVFEQLERTKAEDQQPRHEGSLSEEVAEIRRLREIVAETTQQPHATYTVSEATLVALVTGSGRSLETGATHI